MVTFVCNGSSRRPLFDPVNLLTSLYFSYELVNVLPSAIYYVIVSQKWALLGTDEHILSSYPQATSDRLDSRKHSCHRMSGSMFGLDPTALFKHHSRPPATFCFSWLLRPTYLRTCSSCLPLKLPPIQLSLPLLYFSVSSPRENGIAMGYSSHQ